MLIVRLGGKIKGGGAGRPSGQKNTPPAGGGGADLQGGERWRIMGKGTEVTGMKKKRGLSARQWLYLDAAGSFLAGGGMVWVTAAALEEDDSFAGAYLLVLDLLPVSVLMGLAALLLWCAWENGELLRGLAGAGAVTQLFAGGIHLQWALLLEHVPSAALAVLVLAAGGAGLWAAVFGGRRGRR